MLDSGQLHHFIDGGKRCCIYVGTVALIEVVCLSFATKVKCLIVVEVAARWQREIKVLPAKCEEETAYPFSKWTLSSLTYGAMYVHCASAASVACSMQNTVVASAAIPLASTIRHACRPSHVAGILMQTLLESKSDAKPLKMARSPVWSAPHLPH